MCELQQGVQFSLDTDGAFEVLSIPPFSAPIPVIDDTDLADSAHRPKCAGALRDPQLMTGIRIRSVGLNDYPTLKTQQTLTITHATVPGNATAETFVGTGFFTDVRTPEFNSDTENRKVYECDWQFDGNTSMPARTKATSS